MSRDAARGQWEAVPTDPDLAADFGYALLELEVIRTGDDRKQVIVLPKDEDLLRGDAFLVVDEDDLCDVGEWS